MNVIKRSRHKWLGHMERREGTLLNKIYRGNTGEKKTGKYMFGKCGGGFENVRTRVS